MSEQAPVLGLDDPALPDGLERNQWEFIRGFAAVPGVDVVDDGRILCVATGVPSPLFNPVLCARLAPDDVDRAIEDVRAWYSARRVPWSWYVGPASSPDWIARELERRGFVKVTEPPGMAAGLADVDALEPGAQVEVRRVDDPRLVDEWFGVFAPAFDLSKAAASAFRELVIAGGLGDDAPMRNYLATQDGRAVATGSLVPAAGVGGIYNIATRADLRGRGVGRAMTHALMRIAAGLGYSTAILWSTAAGLPVYTRLGFRECVRVPTYLGPGG